METGFDCNPNHNHNLIPHIYTILLYNKKFWWTGTQNIFDRENMAIERFTKEIKVTQKGWWIKLW